MFKLPVEVKVPVVGSYNSALARAMVLPFWPPAISTLPSFSNVAVCKQRAVFMLPVSVKVPVVGSYNSALASTLLLQPPPAISTLPSLSTVAV